MTESDELKQYGGKNTANTLRDAFYMEANKALEQEEIEEMENEAIALMEKSYDITRDGDQEGLSGVWNSEINAFADSVTLMALFFNSNWVYSINDLIAGKISAQEMKVMSHLIQNGQEVCEPDHGHPLSEILHNPNPHQDYHSFMYWISVQLSVLGNAIIWYNKSSKSLIPLCAQHISLDFDQDRQVSGYLLATANEDNPATLIGRQAMLRFPVNEIIHIRRPNPSSMLWGLSPLVAGRESVLLNRYNGEYLNAFYQKQATPGLALKLERKMTKEQALRQLRFIEMAYQGRKNSRRTMLIPEGASVQAISHSIADQNLVSIIDKNREDILMNYHAPKHEFGLQTSGSLGSEEHKTSLKNFWHAQIIPSQKMISGAFTSFFAKKLGPRGYFQFDNSDVEVLKDDQLKQAEVATKQENFMTVNEIRHSIGLEALPHKEADYTMGMLRLGIGREEPGIPQTGIPLFDSLFAPQTTLSLSAVPYEKSIEEGSVAFKIMENAGTSKDMELKNLDNEVQRTTDRFLSSVLKMFVEMAKISIKIVKEELNDTKSLNTKADQPSPKEIQRRIDKAFTDELEEDYIEDSIQILSGTIDFGYETQTQFIFNQPDLEAIQALKVRGEKKRRAILEARGLESFRSITKTHTDRIMGVVREGLEKSKTTEQIAKDIAETFKEPEKMAAKAMVIARTESLTAASIGQWAAAQNAREVLGPGVKKQWLTALDDRVRATHQKNENKPVDFEDTFENGLKYPRDLNGPPEETIQCFPASTHFQAEGLQRFYRRWYDGSVVVLTPEGGVPLTGTPNHPILTKEKGWIPLKKVEPGFHVVKVHEATGGEIEGSAGNEYRKTSMDHSPVYNRQEDLGFHGDGRKNQKLDIITVGESNRDELDVFADTMAEEITGVEDLREQTIFKNADWAKVAEIQPSAYSGFVYNMQTRAGVYAANGVLVHNCRCTMILIPPEVS